MAVNLPSAQRSPRITQDGVLEWYQNDNFTYVIDITLQDPDTQEYITIQPEDKVVTTFFTKGTQNIIYTFTVNGSDLTPIPGGHMQEMSLEFSEDISKRFVVLQSDKALGYTTYTYCIKLFNSTGATTIGALLTARVKLSY